MPILENGKKLFEKATGWGRPGKGEVKGLVTDTKPLTLNFKDDGVIPNHPRWPLIFYRGAVHLPSHLDPAAVFEDLFAMNKWGSSWRNGIYSFVHYHSQIHEVVGIAVGSAKVQFGGNRGKPFNPNAGDVAILPAGTGHRCLSSSKDFLVVGAYPAFGKYDLCTSSEDHARALQAIVKTAKPRTDPVYGRDGPLIHAWKPFGGP